MKLLSFNLIAMLILPVFVLATEHSDTTLYDKASRKADWRMVFPDHAKVQIGGGTGIVSLGTGWSYGKKRRWETDFMVGVVKWRETTTTSATLTLKQNYIPWRINSRNNRYFFEPLTASIYICQVWGKNLWIKEPSKYNPPYYGIPTGVRTHISIGERVGVRLKDKYALSLFYEVSTNDTYIFSAWENKYVSTFDILSLSFGLKFAFN